MSLDMDKILVGRGGSCDIRLPHPAVSYLHAVLEMSDTSVTLTDSDSRNGTLLNGKKLVRGKRTRLSSGDVIGICGFSVKVTLSVPLAEAYSAERTDVLEREIFLAATPPETPGCRLEIVAGENVGAAFDLPAAGTVTVGTAQGCDFTFAEKKARELRLTLILTPAGWKIEEATAADTAVPVTMPARGRLHDGDEITAGKTKIVFHDAVDRMLAGLRARREADAQPDEGGTRPPGGGAAAGPAPETSPKPASPARAPDAREGGPGEKYAAEYRIAAVAFGIIVFILSLILLIILFF
jgi:pSer/pThr/pTyr-binding forkhead associated (FHA) protein